jgi:hypothetical protein
MRCRWVENATGPTDICAVILYKPGGRNSMAPPVQVPARVWRVARPEVERKTSHMPCLALVLGQQSWDASGCQW